MLHNFYNDHRNRFCNSCVSFIGTIKDVLHTVLLHVHTLVHFEFLL